MILTKGDLSLRFDRQMKTRNGILCGINLLPNTKSDRALTGNDRMKVHCDINVFHKIYGHASVSSMRDTAKVYGWKLTGRFDPCEDCHTSNAKQRLVKKSTTNKASRPGERIFIWRYRVVDVLEMMDENMVHRDVSP